MRKNKVGHDLEIGTHLGDDTQQHHAFDAAKRMVAHHDKTALFGNVLQLLGTDINSDVHVLKQMVGKLTALIISSSVEQTVDFSKTEVSISRSCDTSAEEAF